MKLKSKSLGISGKTAIEEYGVEAFSKKCIDSVFVYIEEWKKMTRRIGFWVDCWTTYVTFHQSWLCAGRLVGAGRALANRFTLPRLQNRLVVAARWNRAFER
ncbi:MAG: class I tRNA ligase family protein [Polyangiales bacterium]